MVQAVVSSLSWTASGLTWTDTTEHTLKTHCPDHNLSHTKAAEHNLLAVKYPDWKTFISDQSPNKFLKSNFPTQTPIFWQDYPIPFASASSGGNCTLQDTILGHSFPPPAPKRPAPIFICLSSHPILPWAAKFSSLQYHRDREAGNSNLETARWRQGFRSHLPLELPFAKEEPSVLPRAEIT